MKRIILILAGTFLIVACFYACSSPTDNARKLVSNNIKTDSIAGPDYTGGSASAGRLFPDKLRYLPVGIKVEHYPNPCYAVLEDSMYVWKHNTTIQANEDLQIVEYGSFVYTAKGWYLRITMDAAEFASTYNCKNGLLKKGVAYTDSQSWRRDKKLTGGDAMWYYIARDKNGTLVKGTGPIETEGRLLNASAHAAEISSSVINWTGYGEIGNYSLSGTVPVKNADIIMDSSKITAVNLTINLAGIKSDNEQLVQHLKGEDFFVVDKHPTATFSSNQIKYTDASQATISGTLTIKNTSKLISFPLVVQKKNDSQLLSGKIVVDRTAFGIRYNSKSFFSDLGDQAIKNNFDLNFEFVVK